MQQKDTYEGKRKAIRKLAHRKDRARACDSSRMTKVIMRIKIRRKNILPEKKRDTVSNARKPIWGIVGQSVESVMLGIIRSPSVDKHVSHQHDMSFREIVPDQNILQE